MERIRGGWVTESQVREIIMAPVIKIVVDEDLKETKDETVPVAAALAEAVPGRVAEATGGAVDPTGKTGVIDPHAWNLLRDSGRRR